MKRIKSFILLAVLSSRDRHREIFCLLIPLLILIIITGGCTLKVAEPPGIYHPVERGQYLWRIAKIYGVDMGVIMRANRLSDPNKLRAGQPLFIPGAEAVLRVGAHKPPASLKKGSFIWPVDSRRITSRYGTRRGKKHKGIDIAAPSGTKIVASREGKVVYAGVLSGYGQVIIIEHKNGYSTIYAHNSRNLVKVGDRVRQGQVIGRVGSSGRSSGPHLHLEIRKGYQAVNPLDYLP